MTHQVATYMGEHGFHPRQWVQCPRHVSFCENDGIAAKNDAKNGRNVNRIPANKLSRPARARTCRRPTAALVRIGMASASISWTLSLGTLMNMRETALHTDDLKHGANCCDLPNTRYQSQRFAKRNHETSSDGAVDALSTCRPRNGSPVLRTLVP